MIKHSWQSLRAPTRLEFLDSMFQAAEFSEQDFGRVVQAQTLSFLYFFVCAGFSTIL